MKGGDGRRDPGLKPIEGHRPQNVPLGVRNQPFFWQESDQGREWRMVQLGKLGIERLQIRSFWSRACEPENIVALEEKRPIGPLRLIKGESPSGIAKPPAVSRKVLPRSCIIRLLGIFEPVFPIEVHVRHRNHFRRPPGKFPDLLGEDAAEQGPEARGQEKHPDESGQLRSPLTGPWPLAPSPCSLTGPWPPAPGPCPQAAQHFLYFFPLPHGQGSLRPAFFSESTGCCGSEDSPPPNCNAASSLSFLRWILRVKSSTEF